jgi:hypothetical protein
MVDVSVAGVKFVSDFIIGVATRFKTDKRELFDNHIEPLFLQMKDIHDDYLKGFHAAKVLIQTRATPTSEIIQFLDERRLFLYVEREVSASLAEELKIGRSILRREPGWQTVEKFCQHIIHYFHAAGTVGCVSWFTDYLTQLRMMSKYDFATWDQTAIAGDPHVAMLEGIENIITKQLPKAFAPIINSYSQLRIELK